MSSTPASASKLIPADPNSCTVIRQISQHITTVSAPFSRFGLVKVGGRATIVKLANGTLAVFSPTALTQEVRGALSGPVSYITCPDIEHHIYLTDWARAFPQAKIIGPDGLAEKREKDDATKGIKFSHVWTAGNKRDMSVDEVFDKEFDVEFVHTHSNKELVFNHRPSRTLIEADLMFNLPCGEQYSRTSEGPGGNLLNRMFTGMMSTQGSAVWHKRFLWYAASARGRDEFNESVRRINSWDWDAIVPCHGDVIEQGGKGVFRKVFEWHLQGQGKAK